MKRRFGDFPLGFGGAAVSGEGRGYGFGAIGEDDAMELLKAAYHKGLRLFDTAPIYGFGLSERRIGKALKEVREEVCIVSKSGVTWHPNKRVHRTNDPQVAQKMLEQSLRDLNSDYIDLYMIHWPDEEVDIRRPLEYYARALDKGHIRNIGLCNTTLEDLEKAKEVVKVYAVQSEYNLFSRQSLKNLGGYFRKNDIGFMSWGTLDKGILTRRVHETRTFDEDDCRSWAPWWDKKEALRKVESLEEKVWPLLQEHGYTGLELALAHNLQEEELDMALCGPRNLQQLGELCKALDHLPPKTLVDQVLEFLQNS